MALEHKQLFFSKEAKIFANLWHSMVTTAQLATKSHGEFNLMLSGGNTPLRFYKYILENENLEQIDWPKVNIFFSDERHVAQNSAENNFKNAYDNFLKNLACKNIFAFNTELKPEAAAKQMSEVTLKHFNLKNEQTPIFDFCFLGFGPDGHFASIFPDTTNIDNAEICSAYYVKKLEMWRLTFNLTVFKHATELCFIVAGTEKKTLLNNLGKRARALPIDYLAKENNVTWLILQ